MNNRPSKKEFDHKNAQLADRLSLVSELEHLRRHLLRSSVSVAGTEDEVFYLVMANRCKNIRREYMQKYMGDIPDELWCAVKSASCLRQLSYETNDRDDHLLKDIDDLCDEIFTEAFGEDMFGCAACREDREKEAEELPPLSGVNSDFGIVLENESGDPVAATSDSDSLGDN